MADDIGVLVVDDQALLRDSFTALVDASEGMSAVNEATTGGEAVALAATTGPDVVLMDIRMPDMDGIEATRRICAAPDCAARVLILTTFDLDEYVYAALRAGASGFLVKDTPASDVLAAIRVVAAGESLLSPRVTRRLIAEFTRRPASSPTATRGLDGVTPREREVLRLIGGGLSNMEIASHMNVSLGTVKTHVGRLLRKLDARDRAQLVIAAFQAALVTVND